MAGNGLGELIEGFLAADGFAVERPAPHCLAGVRDGADGGGPERRYVWLADPDNGIAPDHAALLEDFAAAKGALGPRALGFFVTPSLAGLATSFRQAANAAGIGVRVPVQFFDTAYVQKQTEAFGEGGGAAASEVLRDFQRFGSEIAASRVPQPYEALTALGAKADGFRSGPDLLDHLVRDLATPPSSPRLTIVLGNAGAGKSYLFAALFAALHERFMDAKRRHLSATRPVLFLPEHIRDRRVATLQGLLEAVATTEAAATTRPSLMQFLNREGFTTWMFDGLDEFFAGETDFVAALEAGLAPGSRAQTLVCTRDSLLTSSSALRGLVERHIGDGRVRLFELARWQRPSQRALAWVRHAGRLPAATDKVDPPEVAAFLAALEAFPAAADLATLPYYCDLMLDLGGSADAPKDELDLLAAAVDGLIDREQGKLASGELGFRWDVFSGADTFTDLAEIVASQGGDVFNAQQERERLLALLERVGRDRLVELIEGIAHQMRTSLAYPNQAAGLSAEEIEDLANYYLDVGLEPELEPRVLLGVVQFAFFGRGSEGVVSFAHEIVADFLAGRHAMRILRGSAENPDCIAQALGIRRDLDRSILLRYLVRELAREPDIATAVRSHIEGGRVRTRSMFAVGQLLAAMDAARI